VRLAQAPLREEDEPQALEVAPGEGEREGPGAPRVWILSVLAFGTAELRDLGGHVVPGRLGLDGRAGPGPARARG